MESDGGDETGGETLNWFLRHLRHSLVLFVCCLTVTLVVVSAVAVVLVVVVDNVSCSGSLVVLLVVELAVVDLSIGMVVVVAFGS